MHEQELEEKVERGEETSKPTDIFGG